MPDGLAFVIRGADTFDIPSEYSLSLKLSVWGVAGFLLLENEVLCSGLVINMGLYATSKGFELTALVTEGTRTGFTMLVLLKLTVLSLSKLCEQVCLLRKIGEKHHFVWLQHIWKASLPLLYGSNFQET